MLLINIISNFLKAILGIFNFFSSKISDKFIFLKNIIDSDIKREQKIKEHFKFQKKLNSLNNEI